MERPLTGISSMATRGFLAEVLAAWHQAGGVAVSMESTGGVDAARRVREGERFDLIVLAADAIDKLEDAGLVRVGSRRALVRSEVAVAVREGAPRPAVDTAQALREAVRASRAVGYSTGPSGVALQQLFTRWGLADEIRDRLVQAPAGVPVGAMLARGDIDLGFQQLSELMHVKGIDVLGPMPPGLEIVTTFCGAVGTSSQQLQAALALLDFIRSDAADAARQHHGLQAV